MSTKNARDVEKTEIRSIKVDLTERELLDKGQCAAELKDKIDKMNIEFNGYKKDIKNKIGILDFEQQHLLIQMKEKKELRDINCVVKMDFEDNKVYYLYNGEIVDTRTMTYEDRQQKLALKERALK